MGKWGLSSAGAVDKRCHPEVSPPSPASPLLIIIFFSNGSNALKISTKAILFQIVPHGSGFGMWDDDVI